jgi:hypothetical protein
MTAENSTARSPSLPIALSITTLPPFLFDGCWTVTRVGETTTFTHSWWTGPAFFVVMLAAFAWSTFLWRIQNKIKAVGSALIAVFLTATLAPKHMTEFISVSPRGVEGRTGTWWWKPDIWKADFAGYSEVLMDERLELITKDGKPEINVERSLSFVSKGDAPSLWLPVNGLLRDSNADAEILRRAREAGLNTDPAASPHLKNQKDFTNELRKQYGFPPMP